MKIGILTYYDVHNHGSYLQAYALKQILTNAGHEVIFLRYKRDYSYLPNNSKKKYDINLSSIPFYFNYMLNRGFGNFVFNLIKHFQLSSLAKHELNAEIDFHSFDGDCVIIGSDEVFSVEIGYNPFFYGHEINTKVITYAASFGPSSLDDIKKKGLLDCISRGLKAINSISVRDLNSEYIVESIIKKSPPIVCDPVILYGYKKEIDSLKFKNKKPYVLVYSYDKNMNETSEIINIQRFARQRGMKVISVGYHHKWCDKNINASPFLLLKYIENASFVITDTFHGAVISIITNANFIVKTRQNGNKLGFLMEEYHLSHRIVNSFSNIEYYMDNKIDYQTINSLILQKRQASMDYLRLGTIEK